jgi:hypothetical protein
VYCRLQVAPLASEACYALPHAVEALPSLHCQKITLLKCVSILSAACSKGLATYISTRVSAVQSSQCVQSATAHYSETQQALMRRQQQAYFEKCQQQQLLLLLAQATTIHPHDAPRKETAAGTQLQSKQQWSLVATK